MAKDIITRAEDYCSEHNFQLTPPRRAVLKILAKADKPLTAYEVLDSLGGYLEQPKPPTAYRALDFVTAHGFAHRIESLNAYIACHEDHRHRGSQYMICDSCGRVDEIHSCHIPSTLSDQADRQGFRIESWNAELHGVCDRCNLV